MLHVPSPRLDCLGARARGAPRPSALQVARAWPTRRWGAHAARRAAASSKCVAARLGARRALCGLQAGAEAARRDSGDSGDSGVLRVLLGAVWAPGCLVARRLHGLRRSVMLDTSSPVVVATVAASVAAASAAACTYHWTTAHQRGSGDGRGDIGDGNAGGLAGYAQQLRAGSADRAEDQDSDTPFIADVWLQGGQPVSDGPDSTTFKFKFAKGDMPTGRRPDKRPPKPAKPAASVEL